MSTSQPPLINNYQNIPARMTPQQLGFNPASLRGGTDEQGNQFPGPHSLQPEAIREAQQRYRAEAERRQHNANNLGAPNRMGMPSMASPTANPNMAGGMQPPTRPMMNPAQVQKARAYEQQFMASLTKYLAGRGQTLEPDPKVLGRTMNYMALFNAVTSRGILMPGHPNLGNWFLVAAHLGFPPNEHPSASEELKGIFGRNMSGFVQHWLASMQKLKTQQQSQQMQQMQQQGAANTGHGRPFPQMSPTSPQRQPNQSPQALNAYSASPQQMQQPDAFSLQQPPSLRDPSPSHSVGASTKAPLNLARDSADPRQSQLRASNANALNLGVDNESHQHLNEQPRPDFVDEKPAIKPQGPTDLSLSQEPKTQPNDHNYQPRKRGFSISTTESHGGLQIDALAILGEQLARIKPGVPQWEEMGAVDIHALTMSLRSGFHAETRYALDHLVGLSSDPRCTFHLEHCEGLLEALVDCGEDQVELLAEHCQSVDVLEYPNFESLSKLCRKDALALRTDPPFASTEHELIRSADRLIAVTTVLRNLSIPDLLKNHDTLLKTCVSFMTYILRSVGSRPKLLRTSQNLLDFMKDLITFLANLAHRLEIPSKEDADALIRFLISFAPEGSPSSEEKTRHLTFQSYDPRRHQYIPSAIDSLAKLLSRDEPNRSLFKSLLSEDKASHPETSLLTRAFALAVAPVPDRQSSLITFEKTELIRLARERNHFLTQGMLAGDVLATLIPGSDQKTASAWLESEDGWGPSLLHLLTQIGFERGNTTQMRHHGRADDPEADSCSLIAQRGFSLLKKLSEKADKVNASPTVVPDVRPDRQVILKALGFASFETGTLRNLLAFGALDG